MTAWAPGNAQTSKLPPCHLLFVFNVQLDEHGEPLLCLHLTQRSADVALGVPYNIAGYALSSSSSRASPASARGIFGHTLVDAHVYTAKADGTMAEYDHVPGLTAQLERDAAQAAEADDRPGDPLARRPAPAARGRHRDA